MRKNRRKIYLYILYTEFCNYYNVNWLFLNNQLDAGKFRIKNVKF